MMPRLICQECKSEGFSSKVFEGYATSTTVFCRPFYDEGGDYHMHDSNMYRMEYSCSRGHNWVEVKPRKECPACGKWWEKNR